MPSIGHFFVPWQKIVAVFLWLHFIFNRSVLELSKNVSEISINWIEMTFECEWTNWNNKICALNLFHEWNSHQKEKWINFSRHFLQLKLREIKTRKGKLWNCYTLKIILLHSGEYKIYMECIKYNTRRSSKSGEKQLYYTHTILYRSLHILHRTYTLREETASVHY